MLTIENIGKSNLQARRSSGSEILLYDLEHLLRTHPVAFWDEITIMCSSIIKFIEDKHN